ncbi:MAG TPA: dihydrofolate reductase family protein [Chloroflexota bacterium]|nr:dihydrofolate reductase family protein [Chloroflexota bacterium]
MPDRTISGEQRKHIGWVTLSLDGYSAGPGNDMSRIAEHAGHEQMMAYTEGIWRGVSTAVMGRTNYEGFFGYWPPVAKDPASTPRNRDLAIWLDTVEKVVFSRTMQRAEWQNTRVASDLETEIRALKAASGRDILVLNSASIIQALLNSELLDELQLFLVPVLLGGGLRSSRTALRRPRGNSSAWRRSQRAWSRCATADRKRAGHRAPVLPTCAVSLNAR